MGLEHRYCGEQVEPSFYRQPTRSAKLVEPWFFDVS